MGWSRFCICHEASSSLHRIRFPCATWKCINRKYIYNIICIDFVDALSHPIPFGGWGGGWRSEYVRWYWYRIIECDISFFFTLWIEPPQRTVVTALTVGGWVVAGFACRSAFSLPRQIRCLQSPIKCGTQSIGPSFVAPRLILPFVLVGKRALHNVFAAANIHAINTHSARRTLTGLRRESPHTDGMAVVAVGSQQPSRTLQIPFAELDVTDGIIVAGIVVTPYIITLKYIIGIECGKRCLKDPTCPARSIGFTFMYIHAHGAWILEMDMVGRKGCDTWYLVSHAN